jgi:hypothetical protein
MHVHNDNNYLKMLAQSQALAQAAAEAGKDRAVDRARAQAAEAVQKLNEAAEQAELKKIALSGEKTGDGNQQGAPGYRPAAYSKEGKVEAKGEGDSSNPPPGMGRIDIRI